MTNNQNPIRVALIGCGGVQARHAKRFRDRDDADIVALCDVDGSQVDRFLQRTPLGDPEPPRFTDAAAMYSAVKPDAVSICTPHTLHFDQGMQALAAGCHVLMEKPMVTSAPHAYQIARKVAETGKVFVIGYNTPYTPELAYLRRLIRERQLGRLELVVGHLSQAWLGPTAGSWRQDPELSGGGQAYDSGSHALTSLCWTVESPVAEVFAFIDNCGAPVDINSSINIRFESGVLASMVISGNCPVDASHMAYMFDGGKVEIDGWHAGWINVYRGTNRVEDPPISGEPMLPGDNFLDTIGGRAEPRTSPAEGIIHSELMDAIYESARTGRPACPRRD